MDYSFLKTNRIIPVVVCRNEDDIIPLLANLLEGGIKVAEITFRTACAENAIKMAVAAFPGMIIGAGTVLSGEQCIKAIAAGARFIVSPGFSKDVADICKGRNVPYLPGAVTPTEITAVIAEGFNIIKFFPASVFGGISAINALSAAFGGVKFIPTGGVNPENVGDYLSSPFVEAVGGSWMINSTPEENRKVCGFAYGGND